MGPVTILTWDSLQENMSVCRCVCVHIWAWVLVHVCAYGHVCVHMGMCVCAYGHGCMGVHVWAWVQVHVCMCGHVCAYLGVSGHREGRSAGSGKASSGSHLARGLKEDAGQRQPKRDKMCHRLKGSSVCSWLGDSVLGRAGVMRPSEL